MRAVVSLIVWDLLSGLHNTAQYNKLDTPESYLKLNTVHAKQHSHFTTEEGAQPLTFHVTGGVLGVRGMIGIKPLSLIPLRVHYRGLANKQVMHHPLGTTFILTHHPTYP